MLVIKLMYLFDNKKNDFHHLFAGPVLVKAKKGTYILLYDSYTYRRSAKSKKGTVWKCTSSKIEDCKATLITDDNLNVVVTRRPKEKKHTSHTHKPTPVSSKPKHVYFTTQ